MMLGRTAERALIDALLTGARGGRSDALVITGEPGIGKTTLIGYAIEQAAGMRVLTARGYEDESEIPFAGLADLLRPVLDGLDGLPGPQAAALRSALALGPPVAGDRFTVCAATVGILAAAAETSPLLIVVDDLQWLDASSREAVLFAGRRLHADGIALLVATRNPADAADLRASHVALAGLSVDDVDELCRSTLPAAPPGAAARLHAATAGNPLGVIELSRERPDHQDAGVAAPYVPPGSRIERALQSRLAELPGDTRRALVLAAAAVGGDTGILLLAAEASGLHLRDFAPAETQDLITIDDRRTEFRHPLLRSVVYHAATMDDRCAAHNALAAVLADIPGDAAADARAWHLAAATLSPDEDVATLLQEAALRASSRAGYVGAARAFGQAARLSRGPDRARRLLRAARCWQLAGRNDQVLPLLDEALPLTTEPSRRALIQHMSAYVRMWRERPDGVLEFLVASAEAVEEADPGRAALMYTDACIPYFMVGDIEQLQAVVRRGHELAARAGGPPQLVAAVALAGGLTLAGERGAADALLRRCHPDLMRADPLVRAQDLCHAALTWIWLEGFDAAGELLDRVIAAARSAGALGVLPQALGISSELHFRVGDWHDARASAAESLRLASETRQADLYGLFFNGRLDAVQGRADDCRRRVERTIAVAERLGVDCMALYTGHELGLLALSQGEAGEAITHLEAVRALPVAAHIRDPAVVPWVFDLVEAYIRDGRPDAARELLDAQQARPGGMWADAAAARCRALLAPPEEMAAAFKTALESLGCALMPFERARTELSYGERLRRQRQRAQARKHLHDALETFTRLGAQPWAERARSELSATGTTVRRSADALPRLTPQELQVALVVARGATNHEAAATLFLSQKTIEYHLSNIYRKTNIRSRTDLAGIAGAAKA
ncbi:AAA family ATPase [Amorphoplanes digitatis]|uniref:DNA-binding CsgD family transcriptional regulator n=1 Tax=Actinoplanes digitatis TaxID=1868 RepID=A0A7W7MPW8_9ACTN|nr:helix-turn-helix transcriptional regulator [Actinoplanes digitatis]MBB4762518.1 DNA-binding CsgD family transcriptional regulator [Actinoplanes digitatis]GID92356.1 transcriptional regulator [Actinoplanes digitatis]